MSGKRSKTKTAVMTLRVEPHVKIAAQLAAQHEHRSVANLIEVLILAHCRDLNLAVPQQSKVRVNEG
jgi:hypothetical protein